MYRTRYPSNKFTEKQWENAAINYAVWLANKRGIELPDWRNARASWGGVMKYRDSGRSYYEPRVRSVEFGRLVETYNTRKDGRRGAYAAKVWQTDLEIELPNWDWVPEVFDLNEKTHLYNFDFYEQCADRNREEYRLAKIAWEIEREEEKRQRDSIESIYTLPNGYLGVEYREEFLVS